MAAPLAAQGAVLSPLVAGREILVTAAGNSAYGSLELHVDGGKGARALLLCNIIGIFCHQCAVFETIHVGWFLILEGRQRRNMAMKVVQGMESVGSRAFICHIRLGGFMSPSSGYFNNSNALVQGALVYPVTSRAFSCS